MRERDVTGVVGAEAEREADDAGAVGVETVRFAIDADEARVAGACAILGA